MYLFDGLIKKILLIYIIVRVLVFSISKYNEATRTVLLNFTDLTTNKNKEIEEV